VKLPKSQNNGTDGHCDELYRYDAEAGERGEPSLLCVSCSPSGAPPEGSAQFARSNPKGPASGPVRAMSNDGAYVFFDTPSRLVPTAENHTLHVYEWHEGNVSLISSPNDPFPSYFLGYSPYYLPNGEKVEAGNVFFGTHARLLSEQTNTLGNIYDARACEPQSPCIQPEKGETAQCLGGECQKPPPAPADQTPSSQTFSGAPNLTPPPASSAPPKPTAAQERAKKLAVALKLCRKKRNRHNRAICERAARKKYGAVKASKRKA